MCSKFEATFRDLVNEILNERLNGISMEPELITVKEFCDLYGVDKSTVHALIHERATNGFPAIVLGPRTIKIDKTRLGRWFAYGGLTNGNRGRAI